jgi:hypothetical protein
MVIHPLRKFMQFSGCIAQRLGAIAPHIRDNLIIDVLGKAAQVLFQMCGAFP